VGYAAYRLCLKASGGQLLAHPMGVKIKVEVHELNRLWIEGVPRLAA
jgi:hypothetical protein